MGFRFRKSFTILPGVRINLSKTGISTSLGRPGATLNIGRRGPRATVGLPGTGLSYDQALPGGGGMRGLRGIGCAAVVAGGALALAMCSGDPGGSGGRGHDAVGQGATGQGATGQGATGQATTATRAAYVTATSANCRVSPAADAPVATTLARGRSVAVGEVRDGWSHVAAGATSCWVAERLLASSAPAPVPRTGSPRPASVPQRDAGECACGSARRCTGPRGGRYCLTGSGRKRYG